MNSAPSLVLNSLIQTPTDRNDVSQAGGGGVAARDRNPAFTLLSPKISNSTNVRTDGALADGSNRYEVLRDQI